MPTTKPGITESNRDDFRELLNMIDGKLDRLLAIWDEHSHILLAYKRGGFLAARTAAKRGGDDGAVR